jgi:hypothetical protein
VYIYSLVKQLRSFGMSGDWSEEVNRIADTSTTERYMTRPGPSYPCRGQSQADESGTLRQQTVSERSINRLSGGGEIVGAHSGSNMAAWAYTRYSFLFFLALLVTWVCHEFLHGFFPYG